MKKVEIDVALILVMKYGRVAEIRTRQDGLTYLSFTDALKVRDRDGNLLAEDIENIVEFYKGKHQDHITGVPKTEEEKHI